MIAVSDAIQSLHPKIGFMVEDGKILVWESVQPMPTQSEIAVEVARLELREPLINEIEALEASIDSPRMRREYAEGVRKQLASITPSANELWAINKVKSVAVQINDLRSQLSAIV